VAADFQIKSFDRLPSIQATLNADLTTAVDVKFIMRPSNGGTVKVNAAATIVNPSGGVVRYDWLTADTDTPGQFQAEWEVHWPGPKTQTFPTATYHSIEVVADLDGAA
jgi:hypothetical protein